MITNKNTLSSSQINSDLPINSQAMPLTFAFRNVFESSLGVREQGLESIFNEQQHQMKSMIKYDTSNANSFKSHSSPFSDNKSSHSFFLNDQINLLPIKQPAIINRGEKSLGLNQKTYRSDEPLQGRNDSSNQELNVTFPMFFSQLELTKKDQVVDTNMQQQTQFSGFYGKTRNRQKSGNADLISKNMLMFKKKRKGKTSFCPDNTSALIKRLQMFVNDRCFFIDGVAHFPQKEKKRTLLWKVFISGMIGWAWKRMKEAENGLISEYFMANTTLELTQKTLQWVYRGLMVFYIAIVPIEVSFKVLPVGMIGLDVVFVCLMVYSLLLRTQAEKHYKMLDVARILTFFSYILAINDLWSLCFVVLSVEELKPIIVYKPKKNKYLTLADAIIQGLLLVNFLLCVFITVGNRYPSENTWLQRHDLKGSDALSQYLNCFNYILTLCFHKEYNTSVFEQVFSILGSLLFGFAVVRFMADFVMLSYQEMKENRKKQDENLEKCLRKLRIFGKMKQEIVDFLGKSIQSFKEKEEVERTLALLNHDLRERMIRHAYLARFQGLKVLNRHFSSEFIENLVLRVKILQKKPKDLIFLQGELENQGLYIVEEGEIELYYSSPASVLLNLAHEVYNMMKDKINIYKTPSFLQTPCLFCEDPTHLPSSCPSLMPTPNKRLIIFSRIYSNSCQQRRKLYHRERGSHYHSLKDLRRIQEHAWLILEKHQESISILLDDIYPSSECENSDNQNLLTNSNDSDNNTPPVPAEKTFTDSKDSKGELSSQHNNEKKNDDQGGLINPPSIFLQPTVKNKRKSTGSIFEREDDPEIADEDEEEFEDRLPSSEIVESEKKKSEKTLNNEENSKQTLSEGNLNANAGEERKNVKVNSCSLPSEKFYSEKDSSINVNSFKNNSRVKELQKIVSSERDSKFFTEKDTMHLLQNFDKLEKKALLDRLNSSTHKTNSNYTHASEKRNLQSIFSYSKSTSYISSAHKLVKKRNTTTVSSIYKSTHNKKTNYSDYLKYTLFWYDFERMAQFDCYFPHNNMENVVKVIRGDNLLRVLNFGDPKYLAELKKSFHSNQANTSYSSKKTQKRKPPKSNEVEEEQEVDKKLTESIV